MLKKIIISFGLNAFVSISVHAHTISYNGYTLDTHTNIVTGSNLTWLQWDETTGMSINTALANYGADGWRLASYQEMLDLYADFGLAGLNNYPFLDQFSGSGTSEGDPDSESDVQFINLFGVTAEWDFGFEDTQQGSVAVFGDDLNNDGKYNLATVYDDWQQHWSGLTAGSYGLGGESQSDYTATDYIGVALVKGTDDVSAVPLPATGVLFLSAAGIVGFISRQRKQFIG